MGIPFDKEQQRILDWRISSGGIASVIGPPGCGKTTVGSAIAAKLIFERLANKVLLVAYTNAAANEFGWELYNILGESAKNLCLRTGNPAGVDPLLPIPFSSRADDIREKKIIISTNLSLKRLPQVNFDNMIVDEAGIERLEHLLWPLWFGVNPMIQSQVPENIADQVHNLVDLASVCGVVATVVGDPKQSRPISPREHDYSAIDWVKNRAPSDTLHITHRLPGPLSSLVNDFADYGGLKSAPEIESRRLTLKENPEMDYREIIQPEDVTTWVDINGIEQPYGVTSWANDTEAKACAKICNQLNKVTPESSIAVVTRFVGQRNCISQYLQRMGLEHIRVTTTTGALGTQADVVLFSLARNNENKIIGAAGTLEDLNVSISRAKNKLIILGNFDMMLNGWSYLPTSVRSGRRSHANRLAKLIDHKYGKIITAPSILTC